MASPPSPSPPALRDRLGRPLRDLRVSVTDRCNFRCRFCMPPEQSHEFLPRSEVLSYEETARLAERFVALGVRRLRLTGGEPLVRRDLDRLVRLLAALPIDDLALTTNGDLLAERAVGLREAGLRRVTVSLHSLDPATFSHLTGGRGDLERVLRGIEAAAAAGLTPVKINAVVVRGVNEAEVPALARRFREPPYELRFIETMDVGTVNAWQASSVVPAREIVAAVDREAPLVPVPRRHAGEPARRWRYRDGEGSLGVIASITEPFCGDCSRARLAADGTLYTCLFSAAGHDLKTPLRAGESDQDLEARIADIWGARTDRYSEERAERLARGEAPQAAPRVEMFRVGG